MELNKYPKDLCEKSRCKGSIEEILRSQNYLKSNSDVLGEKWLARGSEKSAGAATPIPPLNVYRVIIGSSFLQS